MATKYFWTDEKDRQIRELNGQGLTIPKIAAAMGVSYSAVQVRMAQLGVQPAFAKRVHQTAKGPAKVRPVDLSRKSDVTRHQDIRRGFSVPRNLQSTYFELLKGGLAIADARQRLGL